MVETHQAVIESLREELEAAWREAEEFPRKELREIKALAESRERELRKTQESRLADVKADAERKVAAIQAQREAENRALRARHEEETARLQRGYEQRLAQEDERKKSKTWAIEERAEKVKIQRDTELWVCTARLKELETARLAQESSAEEALERVVGRFGAEVSTFENRVADLQEALQESETLREDLERQLAALSSGPAGSESSGGLPDEERATPDEPAEVLREIEAGRILAAERILDLEAQLRETRQGAGAPPNT